MFPKRPRGIALQKYSRNVRTVERRSCLERTCTNWLRVQRQFWLGTGSSNSISSRVELIIGTNCFAKKDISPTHTNTLRRKHKFHFASAFHDSTMQFQVTERKSKNRASPVKYIFITKKRYLERAKNAINFIQEQRLLMFPQQWT